MNKLIGEIKVFMKDMKYAGKIVHEISPGYCIIFTLTTIMNAVVGYYNGVILIKLILDNLERNFSFEKMIPLFLIAFIINGACCIINTVKENLYDMPVQVRFNKKAKELIYSKSASLAFREFYDINIKNSMNLAVTNITIILISLVGVISTFFGTLFSTILNVGTVVVFGKYEVLGLLPLFMVLTIYQQKCRVRINNEDYDKKIKLNAIERRKGYYTGRVFMGRSENQVSRVYGSFPLFLKKFKNNCEETRTVIQDSGSRIYKINLKNQMASGIGIQIVVFLVLAYRAIVLKDLSLGNFWALFYAYGALGGGGILNIYGDIQKECKWIQYLRNYFDIDEEQDGKLPLVLDEKAIEFEFDHVSFIYPGSSEYALEDVSFKIKSDQLVSIVGENGAGKSTFILLMLRLFDPLEGCIRLNGVDIREYKLSDYRKCFATLYQVYQLLPLTIAQNITLSSDYEKKEKEIHKCLDMALIEQKIDQLEHGIYTYLTKEYDVEGYVPSGGELRKLGLAHQFYDQAPILILDEFDAEMDPISEQELNDTIKTQKRSVGILVTHRLSICSDSDLILYFSKGHVIEQGTHEELMELGGEYARVYRSKQRQYQKG